MTLELEGEIFLHFIQILINSLLAMPSLRLAGCGKQGIR